MLTLFIQHIFHSTDRIVYRQFWFGACRLTDVQPTYAGTLIGLETDTGPAASRTAGARLSVCDSGGGEEVESWRIPVSTVFLNQSLRVAWLSSACNKIVGLILRKEYEAGRPTVPIISLCSLAIEKYPPMIESCLGF